MFGIGMVITGGRRTAVLARGDELIDLSMAVPGGDDTLHLLRNWDEALPALERLAASPDRAQHRIDRAQVRWLPPVHYPDKVLCMAANYADHIREAGGEPHDADSSDPFFFFKSPHNALIGDGDDVILPRNAQKMDWEVELAVVIGRRAKYVPRESAMETVAGYTILNDVSRRERQRRPSSRYQFDWVGGKCGDNSGPCGPVIIPQKFIADWPALRLRTLVNGNVMQDALAGTMIHDIPRQIESITQIMALQPGDLISTGTPAGVGMGRGEFLKPGDVITTEIDGIGKLTNRCISDE